MSLPKLIITDIDGVWTDGSMYLSESGDELKRFHTSDGAGVKYAHLLNIPVAIITGENTKIVSNRAKKLKVDFVHQGITNKVECAQKICNSLSISLSDCAYIGDDFNDYHLLKEVGISGCPKNAQALIKNIVDIETEKKGGEGAFREFVEVILRNNNLFDQAVDKMLLNNKK